MLLRTTMAAVAASVIALTSLQGCAVQRGQSTVGECVDDTAITTAIIARFVEATTVDAPAISVETLNGEDILSDLDKNVTEGANAKRIARDTKGVRSVRNKLVVR